jgi:hypothetical protein
MWQLTTTLLIALHAVDGRVIYINPIDVVAIIPVVDKNEQQYEGNCVLQLLDGKARAVAETCDVVRQKLSADLD